MKTNRKRANILVVDDESVNIHILNEVLSNEYKIYFATNGQKALDIVAANPIDIILLDVNMPEMDGFEVCRRLKSNESAAQIPIIFVTINLSEKDEAMGFDIGAVDYITKPIRKAVVRARVKSHLEIKRHRDLLEKLAKLDGLTEIPNRRSFDETLENEWRRSKRSGIHLSVAMIDIDQFKLYNDTYGHATGDNCLKEVAQSLKNSCKRPGDFIARYGGEEFAVILSDTDKESALTVVNRMNESVRSLEIEHKGSSVYNYVSLSIGLATMTPGENNTPDTLVEKADAMLYKAKRNGRNRIETF